MKFLDADVQKPLVSVVAIVDEGNTVVSKKEGPHIENDFTKERIPMARKNGVYMLELDVDTGSGVKRKKSLEMSVDAIDGDENAENGDIIVFKVRLDEDGMGAFRRRA